MKLFKYILCALTIFSLNNIGAQPIDFQANYYQAQRELTSLKKRYNIMLGLACTGLVATIISMGIVVVFGRCIDKSCRRY